MVFELEDMADEDTTLLSQVVSGPGQVFHYEYDFGDSWRHEIQVEEFLPVVSQQKYPLCLDGARACPPEDCGSIPGYEDIQKALRATHKSRDQQEIIEWLGDGYDPERFDLEAVNERLRLWRKWR